MRKEFQMTKAQREAIMKASRPVPAMFGSGGGSLFGSPQENANRAWASLGRKLGFDHLTVEPVSGKDDSWFSAVPK